MRIPGLASGMDIDSMVKDMLVKENEKIDTAKQEQQVTKWKQEMYKSIITDTKNLFDKYLSITSPNSILSSKNFTNVGFISSNPSVITATAAPGAQKVNYGFQIESMAKPPQLNIKFPEKYEVVDKDGNVTEKSVDKYTKLEDLYPGIITDKDKVDEEGNPVLDKDGNPVKEGKKIVITTKDKDGKDVETTIEITKGETISTLGDKINKAFPNGEIKANFSEMSGEFTISGKDTGENSSFSVGGDLLEHMAAVTPEPLQSTIPQNGEFKGSNMTGKVLDADGRVIKELNQEKNSFTIDNITYEVNGVSKKTADDKYETTNVNGVTDTTKAVENMKNFIDDYNKLMEKVYGPITEKKPIDFKPLTEEQKKEMSKEEIAKWEEKAKQGILRNDSELRAFMDEIQGAIFGSMGGSGMQLYEMGITSKTDYNKKNQIDFDPEKFAKALEERGNEVYETLASSDKDNKGVFENVKDIVNKYAGSSASIFGKKAGIGGSSDINNVYSKEIQKQENDIKELTKKMKKKEEQLYAKFAALESSLNKYNSQMSYFMQSMA